MRWRRSGGHCIVLVVIACLCASVVAQNPGWKAKTSNTTASFRGLDVEEGCIWASGTNGRFVRSLDGGETWLAGTVTGASDLDLRDVEAFGKRTAYVMSAGEGSSSRIFKTTDAGSTWTLQYTLPGPGGFFDSMAFWDEDNGIVISDPVDGKFVVLSTSNGGRSWDPIPTDSLPPALEGEAAFAASGTCLVVNGRGNVWFATGGGRIARVFRSNDRGRTWSVHESPIVAGKASAGIFSIAFADANNGIAVGGDYLKAADTAGNVAITTDGGRTWTVPAGPLPSGYRSCVAFEPGSGGRNLVAVGTTGGERSTDGGKSWSAAGSLSLNSAAYSEKGYILGVGPAGTIARLDR